MSIDQLWAALGSAVAAVTLLTGVYRIGQWQARTETHLREQDRHLEEQDTELAEMRRQLGELHDLHVHGRWPEDRHRGRDDGC